MDYAGGARNKAAVLVFEIEGGGGKKKMDQEKSFALDSFVRTGTQCNCGDTVDILCLEVFVIVVACVCMCALHVSVLTHSIWQRTCVVYVCVHVRVCLVPKAE